MKVLYAVFSLLSIAMGALSYYMLSNLVVSIALGVLFLAMSFFVYVPSINMETERNKRRHECYGFVNSFIITLSVTSSIPKSYDSAVEGTTGLLRDMIESISENRERDRLDLLSGYFSMDLYRMFLSIVDIYIEQGGDALSLSGQLLQELTRVEESGSAEWKKKIHAAFEFSTLWLMAFGILLFSKAGLSSFYSMMIGSSTFRLCIVAFFVFFAASLSIYFTSFATIGFFDLFKRRRRHVR